MAAIRSFVSAVVAFLFVSSLFCSDASKTGFSIDLIHRDSPRSPFYDPNESQYERIVRAIERSTTRVLRLGQNAQLNAAEAPIISNNGEYLMNISLGTPAVGILAIADTGSDLIWTQCKPCDDCYNQDAPLFNPEKSSTYKDVSCSSEQCQYLGQQSSCSQSESSSCQYSMSYGDQSFTRGNLAVDTVTLGSTDRRPVALPKTIIGCGHENQGTFNRKGSGIVGLGGGPLSLTSQLSESIDGKFSYCLVPFLSQEKKSSTLNFGNQAVVSGDATVTTPLIKGRPDTYYYINMEAISVGHKKIPYTSRQLSGTSGGNMIIDSGTTLTMLPSDVYSEVESAVKTAVNGKQVDSPAQGLNLCYEASSDLQVPKITAHFDGADVELKAINTFIQVTDSVACLAFVGTDSLAIYGNVAQMDFLVGYDRAAGKLSFKPADCAKA